MYALTLMFALMQPPKRVWLPANPCSNPVKCERYKPNRIREGKGPRK